MALRTILVVDDDPDIRDLIAMTLSDEGYNVVSCSDGRTALSLASSNPPSLILLDLMMPTMSGWQIIKNLKATARSADIPVVLVSASRDLSYTAEELGASACLPKPFALDDLINMVMKHIGKPERHEPLNHKEL
ncbi:MAG: response regulator [Chloroflexota bacterium]